MRVISGKARSLRLKTVEGMDTRPTQDRIKETLFNMIQHEIAGAEFLDLFAGSGAIGSSSEQGMISMLYLWKKTKKRLPVFGTI